MALAPYAADSGGDAGPRPGSNNHRHTESPEDTWSEMTKGIAEKHAQLWQEPAGWSFPLPQAHFLLCKSPIGQYCVCCMVCVCVFPCPHIFEGSGLFSTSRACSLSPFVHSRTVVGVEGSLGG